MFCHFGPMLIRASACKSTSHTSDTGYSSNKSERVPVRDAVSISWPLSIAYICSQSGRTWLPQNRRWPRSMMCRMVLSPHVTTCHLLDEVRSASWAYA